MGAHLSLLADDLWSVIVRYAHDNVNNRRIVALGMARLGGPVGAVALYHPCIHTATGGDLAALRRAVRAGDGRWVDGLTLSVYLSDTAARDDAVALWRELPGLRRLIVMGLWSAISPVLHATDGITAQPEEVTVITNGLPSGDDGTFCLRIQSFPVCNPWRGDRSSS